MQFGVRHALACRIARQTEVYRTFALKLQGFEITPKAFANFNLDAVLTRI